MSASLKTNTYLSPKTLDNIGRMGASPTTSNLVSTIGFLAIRPPITMADKKTSKDERKYSAVWQAGIALGGLAVQLAYNSKFEKFSNFLAQKALGCSVDLDLAKNKVALVEALHYAGDDARKIIDMSPEAAETKAAEYAERLVKTTKFKFSDLNPLKVFKKIDTSSNPFEASPGLISQLKDEYAGGAGKMGKEVIKELLDTPQKAKNIIEVSGASKMIHFVILMVSLNMATLLVTKYMKPIANFIGQKLNIDALKDKKTDEKPKENGKKWSNLDKGIFATLGALAAIEGVNLAGNLISKRPLGDIAVGKVFRTIGEKLNIGKAFDVVTKKPFEWIRKEKNRSWLGKQANINDKWVERNVIMNLLLRLGITAPTIPTNPHALYNTVRLVIDEVMNITLLNAADKTVVNPASRKLAKVLKTKPYNEGVKVIADQGIKNIFLICTVMGLLNNSISPKVMDLLKKVGIGKTEKKELKQDQEKNYQNYRSKFIPAQTLDNLNNKFTQSLNLPMFTH